MAALSPKGTRQPFQKSENTAEPKITLLSRNIGAGGKSGLGCTSGVRVFTLSGSTAHKGQIKIEGLACI